MEKLIFNSLKNLSIIFCFFLVINNYAMQKKELAQKMEALIGRYQNEIIDLKLKKNKKLINNLQYIQEKAHLEHRIQILELNIQKNLQQN